MSYPMTAKDKAFVEKLNKERKRAGLAEKDARDKQNIINDLNKENGKLLKEIERLKDAIATHCGLSAEELLTHIEREKQTSENLRILTAPMKLLSGGGFY